MSKWRQELPFELVALACAEDCQGIQEVGGDNKGPAVEIIQKAGEIGVGAPWCAGFVNFCAEYASVVKNTFSPLENVPLQGYVQSYVDYGKDHGWIVPFEDVVIGDIYCVWFPHLNEGAGRYGHIGFVSDVIRTRKQFESISGNSNDDGSREGYEVARKWENYKETKHLFLKWTT